MNIYFSKIFLCWLLTLEALGCKADKNAFDCSNPTPGITCEEGSAKERAKKALNDGDSPQAISLLEAEIAANPEAYDIYPLLSSAYAAEAGFDIFEVVNVLGSGADNSSVFDLISSFLPDPDVLTAEEYAQSLNFMGQAKNLLDSMPEANRTDTGTYDYASSAGYQLSLYTSAYATMYLNQFVAIDPADPSSIDLDRLSEMTVEDAEIILSTLADAAANGDPDSPIASVISETIGTIDSQEGASAKEKLSEYLKANH